jgi:hypothetical protein
MPRKYDSLNDLSIAIHEINTNYRICDFVEECRKEMGSVSDLLEVGLSRHDATRNPVQQILDMTKTVPDVELSKMVTVCERLYGKYQYHRYLRECETAREQFLHDRREYFSARVLESTDRVNDAGRIYELSSVTDLILADWIDKMLDRCKPKSAVIVYEDMTGKMVRTTVRHHPEVVIDEKSVETRLIDRYHGVNAYDSFLLRSYYSSTEGRWILIPIRLISKFICDSDFDDMLEDESRKARGKQEREEDDEDDRDLRQTDDPKYY